MFIVVVAATDQDVDELRKGSHGMKQPIGLGIPLSTVSYGWNTTHLLEKKRNHALIWISIHENLSIVLVLDPVFMQLLIVTPLDPMMAILKEFITMLPFFRGHVKM